MTLAEAKAWLVGLPAAVAPVMAEALDAVAQCVALEAGRRLEPTGPSRPGEAPADPSGALAAAIGTDRDRDGGAQVTVESHYAIDLEYGTARMAARPFLRPAVASTGEQARQIMAKAFARTVSESLSKNR